MKYQLIIKQIADKNQIWNTIMHFQLRVVVILTINAYKSIFQCRKHCYKIVGNGPYSTMYRYVHFAFYQTLHINFMSFCIVREECFWLIIVFSRGIMQ